MMKNNLSKVKLTSRSEDYSQWYLDVAKAGKMFEYSQVPGCMIFLPKAVTIWEKIKDEINKIIKTMGVQNLYLPLFIPMSFLEKEKTHVEGFAPELAIVTVGGAKELEEKLVIRPTSETLFCDFFKNNLKSYRDLPLLYNQRVNVVRREKRTRPFLRTTEFYWQEGHTLHETKNEAYNFALGILNDVYIKVLREFLAIDGISGMKSESEKFAGAESTFTFEPMMSNGWALQICTSHVLGEGFMKQFDVGFQDRDGKIAYPSYTSWGLSTRSIGGLISSHSDDKGLIIPPKLSEFQAVVLPIYNKDNEKIVNFYVQKIAKIITGSDKALPVKGEYFKKYVGSKGDILVDYRNVRLGEKINDFELSGYPIRLECGERDIENNSCVIVSRITGEKVSVGISELYSAIQKMLQNGQDELLKRSSERLKSNVVACYSIEDIGNVLEQGKFAIYEWDKNSDFESEIKDKFKATTRCIPFEGQFTDDILELKNSNNAKVIVARAF